MSDVSIIKKESLDASSGSPKVFPDMASCRVKHSGFGNYLDCLNPWGSQCPYVLSVGKDYLCRHPAGFEILARTKAEQVTTKQTGPVE